MQERIKIILLSIIALCLVVLTVIQIVSMTGNKGSTVIDVKPDLVLQPQQNNEHQHDKPGVNPNANLPKTTINFNETEYNFGTIKDGEKVSHVFKFTNSGNNPLIISNARGSCGCTVPSWPKEPIGPWRRGEILVEFDSKGRTGQQRKTVTINANTESSPLQLVITANVEKQEPVQ